MYGAFFGGSFKDKRYPKKVDFYSFWRTRYYVPAGLYAIPLVFKGTGVQTARRRTSDVEVRY